MNTNHKLKYLHWAQIMPLVSSVDNPTVSISKFKIKISQKSCQYHEVRAYYLLYLEILTEERSYYVQIIFPIVTV